MSKVIIGIHGLGNKPQKKLLESWWKSAIIEGFSKARIDLPKFKFELVYWADLVYDQPENFDETDKDSIYYLDEPYLPSSNRNLEKKDLSFRKKVLQFIDEQMDKLFLNDDFTLNYHSVSDAIMHKYFKELELYYSPDTEQKKLKRESRSRLLKTLEKYKYDDIMLIGHSMGSIIAYDTLCCELKQFNISTFVTMGSPLGLPFIRAKIANELREQSDDFKISTPSTVQKAWYNFADLEDKVALNFNLKKNFIANANGIQVEDFEVENDYEIAGENNPHKSFGYLRGEEFITILNSFLLDKQKFSIPIWLKKMGSKIQIKKILKSD